MKDNGTGGGGKDSDEVARPTLPRERGEHHPTSVWPGGVKKNGSIGRRTATLVSGSVRRLAVEPRQQVDEAQQEAATTTSTTSATTSTEPPAPQAGEATQILPRDAATTAMVRIAQPIADTDGSAHEPQASGQSARPEPLLLDAPIPIRTRTVERLAPGPRLWLMTRPGSPMAEQFRVLSLKLKEQRGLRVVAIAGPTRNSDGAVAAANVALALGEGTRNRVLLLDTNLRRPQVGALFGLPDSPGFSEQVRQHRRQPGNAWEVAGVSGTVSLLVSGAVEKNPAAVLGCESVGELMKEARRAFDYVIVAAPPVLQSADASILQDHLDGMILVVRVGSTRRDSVQAAVEQIGERHFIGTVMVDV